MNTRKDNFLNELNALLIKYKAEIEVDDDRIQITLDTIYDSNNNMVEPYEYFNLGRYYYSGKT